MVVFLFSLFFNPEGGIALQYISRHRRYFFHPRRNKDEKGEYAKSQNTLTLTHASLGKIVLFLQHLPIDVQICQAYYISISFPFFAWPSFGWKKVFEFLFCFVQWVKQDLRAAQPTKHTYLCTSYIFKFPFRLSLNYLRSPFHWSRTIYVRLGSHLHRIWAFRTGNYFFLFVLARREKCHKLPRTNP